MHSQGIPSSGNSFAKGRKGWVYVCKREWQDKGEEEGPGYEVRKVTALGTWAITASLQFPGSPTHFLVWPQMLAGTRSLPLTPTPSPLGQVVVVSFLSRVQLFCDPTDCSLPGSSVHGISQARILEWVAISFFRQSSWLRDQTQVSGIGRWILYHWTTRSPWLGLVQFSSVQSLSHVQLFATRFAAHQASLLITNSPSLLKLMSIESMMPSNYLTLCRPLLLLSSIFPSIRVFSHESVLPIMWPNTGVSASASVLPMNIQDWFPLGLTGWISLQSKGLSRVFFNTTVQKHHSSVLSSAFMVQLSHPHMTTGKMIALTI